MHRTLCLVAMSLSAVSARAAMFPTDFETPASQVNRIYSYFGGVASFTVAMSNQPVFSGQSQQLTINFQPSSFSTNGVGVGSLGIAAPSLAQDAANDTFSITISNPSSATLVFYAVIREDDNASGTIDIANGDDEWESNEVLITPGIHSYNLAYSAFVPSGEGSGNGLQNFNNTPRMAFILNFETRSTLPGGLVTTPTTLYFDHVGFFVGAQTPPPPTCAADVNNDLAVNGSDLSVLLGQFGQAVTPGTGADINGDGSISGADLSVLLSQFGLPC